MPLIWHHYDSYWLDPSPNPRPLLTPADFLVELQAPLDEGADGVLVWGSVRPNDNSTEGAAALQVRLCVVCSVDFLVNPSCTTDPAFTEHVFSVLFFSHR